MKLLCVGLNWKTPVAIRERLAFDGPKLPAALEQLRSGWPQAEFTLLSTCNRTELYAARPRIQELPGVEELCAFLADFHKCMLTDFYDYLYFHDDAGAAAHLFRVAGGLDSLVLGEAQILGQVKQAYQAASDAKAVGPTLHALLQRALAVAKRIQTETALSKGRLSIASAAVDYLRGVFEHFADKTVLVVGAGKMAELTLTHLKELQPRALLLCNRSQARAEQLAQRFGGTVRPFAAFHDCLVEADIVVSSTGATEPLIDAVTFAGIMKRRKQRLMAIIDIAVPRDFAVAIGELDNVLLWNIDDLEKVRYRTLRSREHELDQALRIVDSETEAFQVALAVQQSGPLIGQLEQEYERIVEQELAWLLPQLNGVPDHHKVKVRQFAQRLKNKFLHPPKAALRAEARTGTHHGLLEALRKLFGLSEE